jgi:dihydrofolate reductase
MDHGSDSGRPRISLIAAMARDRVIGVGNRLPWHLPEDLKHFKQVTHGHPIVMGRKTFESIGRLLPGRENRIVSRQPGYRVEGARVFSSLREACEAPAPSDREIFVIGGEQVYREALPIADRLYLTEIDAAFEGDAFFPAWNRAEFREASRERFAPGEGRAFAFDFVVLERIR